MSSKISKFLWVSSIIFVLAYLLFVFFIMPENPPSAQKRPIPWDVGDHGFDAQPISVDIQTNKSIHGGVLVRAEFAVPFNFRQEQITPTVISLISALKKKFPSCQWIVVFLRPHLSAADTGLLVGSGEYASGCLSIRYGIPNIEQADSLSQLMEIAPVLSEDMFLHGINVIKTKASVSIQISDADNKAALSNGQYDSELYGSLMDTWQERVLQETSRRLSLPIPEIEQIGKTLSVFYGGGHYGNEKFGDCSF